MYDYQTERPQLFTEPGQIVLLKIRDQAFKLCAEAGCAMAGNIMAKASGDSWMLLAAIDRLVEIGDLREVNYGRCAGQHRIFTKG